MLLSHQLYPLLQHLVGVGQIFAVGGGPAQYGHLGGPRLLAHVGQQLLQVVEEVAQIDAPLPLHVVMKVALLGRLGLAVAAVAVPAFVLSVVALDALVLAAAAAVVHLLGVGGGALHGQYGLEALREAALHGALDVAAVLGRRVGGQRVGGGLARAELVAAADGHHVDFLLCKRKSGLALVESCSEKHESGYHSKRQILAGITCLAQLVLSANQICNLENRLRHLMHTSLLTRCEVSAASGGTGWGH